MQLGKSNTMDWQLGRLRVFKLVFGVCLIFTSIAANAIDLITFEETHDIYQSDGQVWIVGKAAKVDIPFDVDIPFPTPHLSFLIEEPQYSASGDLESFMEITALGRGFIMPTRPSKLSIEEDYRIADLDGDGQLELGIEFSANKLVTLGVVTSTNGDAELELDSLETFDRSLPNVYADLTSQPDTTDSLPAGLKGSFNVTHAGEGIYNLPLYSPEGVNGLTPALGLAYSTSAGSGLLGLGWNLYGFDVLKRCSGNPGIDANQDEITDVASGVTFTDRDRLCFGGDLLKLQEEGNDYWANGATYRLQDDQASVFEHLEGGQFRYTDENGTVTLMSPIDPMHWVVTTITDLLGNTIEVEYESDSGVGLTPIVESVRYGAYKIEFEFPWGRNDAQVGIWLNQPRIMARYLSKISYFHVDEVTNQETPIREYRMFYEDQAVNGLGPFYLKHVQDCRYNPDGSEVRCLKPLDIAYTQSSHEFSKYSSLDGLVGDGEEIVNISSIDWDSDGKDDLLLFIDKQGKGLVKAYLSGSEALIEIVNEDKNALLNTLDVFKLKDGRKGVVYQSDIAFNTESVTVPYPGPGVLNLPEKEVGIGMPCMESVVNIEPVFEEITYNDGTTKRIEIDRKETPTKRPISLSYDPDDEAYQLIVRGPDPEDPLKQTVIAIRKPRAGGRCVTGVDEEGNAFSEWLITYPEINIPFSEDPIEVGAIYTHQLKWNIDLISAVGNNNVASAYLPMEYCGLTSTPDKLREAIRVFPVVKDLEGDGNLDIIVPVRNNDIEGNCKDASHTGNEWTTDYVNILKQEVLQSVDAATTFPVDLSDQIYTSSSNAQGVKEDGSMAALSIPNSKPAQLVLRQHGGVANSVGFEENGRVMTAVIGNTGTPMPATEFQEKQWQQVRGYSRQLNNSKATLVGIDPGQIGALVTSEYQAEFAEFVDTPGKHWASPPSSRTSESGDELYVINGQGGTLGASGVVYPKSNTTGDGQSSIVARSLHSDLRFDGSDELQSSQALLKVVPESTYQSMQIQQSVPVFESGANHNLTSAEQISGQTASASLANEFSLGQGSIAEDFAKNFAGSFDPFRTVFADFNMDGKIDALEYEWNGYHGRRLKIQYGGTSLFLPPENVSFFTGATASLQPPPISTNKALHRSVIPFDYDGVGCLDVLILHPLGSGRVYRCRINQVYETRFDFAETLSFPAGAVDAGIGILDMNGDGRSDFVVKAGSGIEVYSQASRKAVLAQRFSNQYGTHEDFVEVEYASLVELADLSPARYAFSAAHSSSKEEYISSQTVVSSVTTPVTAQSNNEIEYHYSSAKFDHKTSRFLGFEHIKKTSDLFEREIDTYYYGSGVNGTYAGFPSSKLSGRPVRVDTFNTHDDAKTLLSSRIYKWAMSDTGSAAATPYLSSVFEVSYDKSGDEVAARIVTAEVDTTQWKRVSSITTTWGYGAADPLSCDIEGGASACTLANVVKTSTSQQQYRDQAVRFLEEASSTVTLTDFDIAADALAAYDLTLDAFSGAQTAHFIKRNDEHSLFSNVIGSTVSGRALDSFSAIKVDAHVDLRGGVGVINGNSMTNAHQTIPEDLAYLRIQEQKTLVSDWESNTFALSTEVYLTENEVITTDFDYDPRFGVPQSILVPSGELTSIEYNYLGRPEKVQSNQMLREQFIEECEVVQCNVNGLPIEGAVFKSTSVTTDLTTQESTRQETFSDVLGRTLATKTYLPEDKIVVSRSQYDAKGRVEKVLLPCLESHCETAIATEYTYFEGEEKIVASERDGATTTTRIDFSESGLSTVHSEHSTATQSDIAGLQQASRNLVSTTVYDALGQLKESTQYDLTGDTALTSVYYQYDVLGRLVHTEVKDLQSNQSQHSLVTYDDEKLTKTLYEPNTGVQTEYMDVLGRLRETETLGKSSLAHASADAIKQRINYDAVGRVISTWDSVSEATQRYVYDAYETVADEFPSDFADILPYCPQTALCEVIAGDGKRHDLFSYHEAGDVAGSVLSHAMFRLKGGTESQFRNFMFSYDYDGFGRVVKQTNPKGESLARTYANGRLSSVSIIEANGEENEIYALSNIDRYGRFTDTALGNGVDIARKYDSLGRLKSIQASFQPLNAIPASTVFDEQYALDSAASVLARHAKVFGDRSNQQDETIAQVSDVMEQFIYDGLGRLAEHQYSASFTDSSQQDIDYQQAYQYDGFGNVLGARFHQGYHYASVHGDLQTQCEDNQLNSGTGPNTVRATASHVYCYDQFGRVRMSQRYGEGGTEEAPQTVFDASSRRTISYNAFNKPLHISTGEGNVLKFEYGPDHMRQYSEEQVGGKTKKTFYLLGGAYEVVEEENGESRSRYYIDGLAINERNDAGLNDIKYLVKDYLGSTKLVLSENLEDDFPAIFTNGFDFTPFGARSTNTLLGLPETPAEERRAYTGHEHFDDFGLIHMNGRIYDPKLSRFLTADPFVTDPLDSQTFNRYSYVKNSPLSYSDPSGYAGIAIDEDGFTPGTGAGGFTPGTGAGGFTPGAGAGGFTPGAGGSNNYGLPSAGGVNMTGDGTAPNVAQPGSGGSNQGYGTGNSSLDYGSGSQTRRPYNRNLSSVFTWGGNAYSGGSIYGFVYDFIKSDSPSRTKAPKREVSRKTLSGSQYNYSEVNVLPSRQSSQLSKAQQSEELSTLSSQTGAIRAQVNSIAYSQNALQHPGSGRASAEIANRVAAQKGSSFWDKTVNAASSFYNNITENTSTLIFGAGASAVLGYGFEGSAGLIITPGDFYSFDIGFFWSYGDGYGVNVSGDLLAGASNGDVFNMMGTSTNLNLVAGPLSLTAMVPHSHPLMNPALTVGTGPSLTPVAFSVTSSTTDAFSRQTLIRNIADGLCSLTGDC